MNLTQEQWMFLIDLRRGTCRATAAQDAGVIGPMIRANLVRWDVDPSVGAKRRIHRAARLILLLWVRHSWLSMRRGNVWPSSSASR